MAKIGKDWIEAYFDYGVDVANRRVFLDADIEEASVGKAVRGLYLMGTDSSTKPVEIFISSYGGDVYEALALYDIINTLECPVHTFAYSKCMSAAPLLLAAGEPGHRWVAPHVSLMHHDWSGDIDGTSSQIKTTYDHLEKVGEEWTRLLAKHSKKDFRWWNARAKKAHDFYFSSAEAVEWGLADQVWIEKDADE